MILSIGPCVVVMMLVTMLVLFFVTGEGNFRFVNTR